MINHENKKVNDTLEYFSSEKELLISFMKHFNSIDPDVIIGWHVIGFDLKFLENKCLKLNIPFKIGRLERDIAIDEKKGAGFFAKIPGFCALV